MLPFGLSTSPVTWQKFVDVIVAKLRKLGHILTCHVDDFLVLGHSVAVVRNSVLQLMTELISAGVAPNIAKSQLDPAATVEYLGFNLTFTPEGATIAVPTVKRKDIRQDLARFLRSQTHTARRFSSVLGKIRALHPAHPDVYLKTFHAAKGLAHLLKNHGWDKPAMMTDTARQNLTEILQWLHHDISTQLQLPPQTHHCTLSTDASDWQWGAHLLLPNQPPVTFNGYFNQHLQTKHITEKEAAATAFSLQSLVDHPHLGPGTVIRLQVDAQSLYHALRRRKTRSPNLHTHLIHISQARCCD